MIMLTTHAAPAAPARTPASAQPLPQGWEAKRDKTGRVYYVNVSRAWIAGVCLYTWLVCST